ncbi:hypothetical protein DRW03_32420 [Corallococcus sp. H22C18031201]|nr:hypothetical protein DRW03_32420 [Corallococcus sp. H22C18031201]
MLSRAVRPSPHPFRAHAALPLLLACLSAFPAMAQKLPDVIVTGDPVAPSPSEVGTGLCMASNKWTKATAQLPQSTATYISELNTYMEENKPSRVSSVLRTAFDLSNNLNDGRVLSYGDFVGVVSDCPPGGCGMYTSDPTTPFVSRFRGYLNVTPGMVNRSLHFGFYADDAISMVIFDRAKNRYNVVLRPPELGAPTWRTTNSVTFSSSGLYPIELLYVQITEHAALEFSILDQSFPDFERAANLPPVINLYSSNFKLALPTQLFQTESGRPSYASDLNKCEQCNRDDANKDGNSSCGPYYYCNAAALCAPCNTALSCGSACLACGPSTPVCAELNGVTKCVQCTEDSQCPNGRCDPADNFCRGCNDDGDCPNGRCDLSDNVCRGCNDDTDCPDTGRCDLSDNTCRGCNDNGDCPNGQLCDIPTATCVECLTDKNCPPKQVCATETHQCRECNQDADCDRGLRCSDHVCVVCDTNTACAGNSCNCCPSGTQCAAPTPGAPPSCVECTSDSQCAAGLRCDTANGRCVTQVPECNTADRCGPGCSKCPTDRPFCLDGEVCVQCRNDLECGAGQYCLSGECASSTTDRHCGSRGSACTGTTPFCLTDGSVQNSSCVGCRNDTDCGSGSCDATTHSCTNTGACAVSCAAGRVCDGAACVECYADAHCPCGGTCDLSTKTCSASCDDSGDCLGVQFCSAETQQCERGRRKPGTEPKGGAFCCGTTADATPAGSTVMMLLLAAGFMLLRPSRRVR